MTGSSSIFTVALTLCIEWWSRVSWWYLTFWALLYYFWPVLDQFHSQRIWSLLTWTANCAALTAAFTVRQFKLHSQPRFLLPVSLAGVRFKVYTTKTFFIMMNHEIDTGLSARSGSLEEVAGPCSLPTLLWPAFIPGLKPVLELPFKRSRFWWSHPIVFCISSRCLGLLRLFSSPCNHLAAFFDDMQIRYCSWPQ